MLTAAEGDRWREALDRIGGYDFCHLPAFSVQPLVENAIRYAVAPRRDGGTIVITAQNMIVDESSATLPSHLINASSLPAGTYVCLSITDEGTGIPKENLDKIFDPYFTTKENCNGLGLTSAYSIIRKHDGYITVDSTIGSGTTFCVYLPAAADTTEKEESCVGEIVGNEGEPESE